MQHLQSFLEMLPKNIFTNHREFRRFAFKRTTFRINSHPSSLHFFPVSLEASSANAPSFHGAFPKATLAELQHRPVWIELLLWSVSHLWGVCVLWEWKEIGFFSIFKMKNPQFPPMDDKWIFDCAESCNRRVKCAPNSSLQLVEKNKTINLIDFPIMKKS